MRYVSPSVRETAFNCPHCGALARQHWYSACAVELEKNVLPRIYDENTNPAELVKDIKDIDTRQKIENHIARLSMKMAFFSTYRCYSRAIDLGNIWYSKCFNCDNLAAWIHDRMIYPQRGEAPPANADMPEDIRRDYDEAGAILDLSPRGAAALIRLSIQKLCKELGRPGNNINDDIGALVKADLDPRVQQALDVVRVIGNSAVHPGQIDLRDDRATAEMLFRLLNLIVEKTISDPKHVKEVYESLPVNALDAITKRDRRRF